MRLVEIRELDGPNVFLLKPAMKVEFNIEDEADEQIASGRLGAAGDFGAAAVAFIDSLHEQAGLEGPDVVVAPMETDGNVSVAFSWTNRRAARSIASALSLLATGADIDLDAVAAEAAAAVATPLDDDRPEMILDEERTVPTFGITGTNGKTTTTRLLAHIARTAGLVVGWCTTSGVFINGDEVLSGDYTGPAGARRVLLDPAVEVAVLETARGGILLRGLGYESNDVSIFINVSPDHLGLLGIETVEALAITKSVVSAVTRPTGAAVMNADDLLVWQFADSRPAPVIAVSREPWSDNVRAHLESGGSALLLEDGAIVWHHDGQQLNVIEAAAIPMTFGGNAVHMVENAMHAIAGALCAGYEPDAIRDGLMTFRSDADLNPGRLNLYVTPGGTQVLVDFAHNEAGVAHLLSLAASLVHDGCRIRTVAGSAGDRPDDSIRAMIRLSAEASTGGVYLRETRKYLRGRESNEALVQLYLDTMDEVGRKPVGVWPTEFEATQNAVNDSGEGDVVAIMAYEQSGDIRDWLNSIGAHRGN